jgi:hypothetical protein
MMHDRRADLVGRGVKNGIAEEMHRTEMSAHYIWKPPLRSQYVTLSLCCLNADALIFHIHNPEYPAWPHEMIPKEFGVKAMCLKLVGIAALVLLAGCAGRAPGPSRLCKAKM